MKSKTLVLLVVAGGCGLVAMLGVQQAMQGSPAPARTQTTKVLVALASIETGMRLTSDNVAFKEIPVDSLPEDPIRSEEEYSQRAARVPFMAGDIVRMSKLTEKGQEGKSVAIPKGMRVLAISVDDTHTNSGLVRAGDRVDVLVTYQGKSDRGTPVSKTKVLLEYVEVFAMDDHTAMKMEDKRDSNRAKNVSLLLTPEQVNFVLLAQRKGALSLSWRNRSDDELAQTKDIDDKLLEELEGTVGIHDNSIPLYDRPQSDFFGEQDSEATEAPVSEGPPAAKFLDSVHGNATPATVATLPAPAGPTWKMEVFHGNEPVATEFELKEEELQQTLDSASAASHSLTDLVKSLWGGKK